MSPTSFNNTSMLLNARLLCRLACKRASNLELQVVLTAGNPSISMTCALKRQAHTVLFAVTR